MKLDSLKDNYCRLVQLAVFHHNKILILGFSSLKHKDKMHKVLDSNYTEYLNHVGINDNPVSNVLF